MLSFRPTFSLSTFTLTLGKFIPRYLILIVAMVNGIDCLISLSDFSLLVYRNASDLEPVYCSMSNSNCCFLTCIKISQEEGQVVWYSPLLKNFPEFVVVHTVKGFGIVNKAEIVVFLELSCFFHDPADVGNWISGSSAFSKTNLNIRNFTVHVLRKPGLENSEHYFTSV